MALPLARQPGEKISLPTESGLNKIMALVGSNVETVTYFSEKLQERYQAAGAPFEYAEVIDQVSELVDSVRYKDEQKFNPWLDDLTPDARENMQKTDFDWRQAFVALASANKINAQEILMLYVITDASQFNCGYSNNLNAEGAQAMNDLLNAWLFEAHKLKTGDDGMVFLATNKGEIQRDAKGNSMKVPAEALRSLLNEGQKAFQAYVKKHNPGVTVSMQPYRPEASAKAAPAA